MLFGVMENCPRCCRHVKDQSLNRNILSRDALKFDQPGPSERYGTYFPGDTRCLNRQSNILQTGMMSSETSSASRLPGFDVLEHTVPGGSLASSDLRRLERHSSDSLNQNSSVGPYSSGIKHTCWRHRVMNSEEVPLMCPRSGHLIDSRVDTGKREIEFDRSGVDQPYSLLGRRNSSRSEPSVIEAGCFGRSAPNVRISNTDRRRAGSSGSIPSKDLFSSVGQRELNQFSGSLSSESTSHDIQHKKTKRSLRNLGCMSSADVIPTLTCSSNPSMAIRPKQKARENSHRTQKHHDQVHARTLARGVRNISRHRSNMGEGLTSEERDISSDTRSYVQAPNQIESSRSRKWRAVRSSATSVLSGNTNFANPSSNEYPEASNEVSVTARDSFEYIPERVDFQDERLSEGFTTLRSMNTALNGEDTTSERINTARSWEETCPSSINFGSISSDYTVAVGSASTSRTPPMSTFFDIWNHSQPFEGSSPRSSYTSSPDVNVTRHCPYSSINHSPDVDRRSSSPEYSHGRLLRAPFYRPFRRFPLRPYEESHEYFSFEGVPEILSGREHVERDEISYEHVFMLEANLLLGGLPSFDRHRDMRLDIDNMTYEDLLALEESIGNVCTGLDKEEVKLCLKVNRYTGATNPAIKPLADSVEVKCSICQEDFMEGTDLGVLQCGHNHHFPCIEQWLHQKNECPICKTTAYQRSSELH